MSDDPNQEQSDEEMRATQHVSDAVPKHLQKRRPSKEQIEEQKQIESFLRASEEAGVTKEELADRLSRVVEQLKEDETDSE